MARWRLEAQVWAPTNRTTTTNASQASCPPPPLFNYVYHKGTAKGYLLGAAAGSKCAHTGPVITDGDAFWEAYIGLGGGDGRCKGSQEYSRRTARRSIETLFAQGTGKGKRGGQKDRRQGKGIVVNYGGQGRGKGGHEKGGQGKGQIAAAQWARRRWPEGRPVG